jgi:hypothetical protein
MSFTIYHRPLDVPGAIYVVRASIIHAGGVEAGPILGEALTLEGARALVPPEADVLFPRADSDPRTIVETWM